jgi:hypothetical protein
MMELVELLSEMTHGGVAHGFGTRLIMPREEAMELRSEKKLRILAEPVDTQHTELFQYLADHIPCSKPGLVNIPDVFEEIGRWRGVDDWYIVGAGWSAQKTQQLIPTGARSIALNSVINIDFPWTWWCVMDWSIMGMAWWPEVRVPDSTRTLFSWPVVKIMLLYPELARRIDYGFDYNPAVKRHAADCELIRGSLRKGMTVLGAALQFAYFAGAKHIHLLGCEQHGSMHWDYSEYSYQRDTWTSVTRLNMLIKQLEREGVKVSSLGQTELVFGGHP